MPRGEKNKLSKDNKVRILELKGKKSAYKVAERFNVSHTTIYKIWKEQNRNQEYDSSSIEANILQKLLPFLLKEKLIVWGFTPQEKKYLKKSRSLQKK